MGISRISGKVVQKHFSSKLFLPKKQEKNECHAILRWFKYNGESVHRRDQSRSVLTDELLSNISTVTRSWEDYDPCNRYFGLAEIVLARRSLKKQLNLWLKFCGIGYVRKTLSKKIISPFCLNYWNIPELWSRMLSKKREKMFFHLSTQY